MFRTFSVKMGPMFTNSFSFFPKNRDPFTHIPVYYVWKLPSSLKNYAALQTQTSKIFLSWSQVSASYLMNMKTSCTTLTPRGINYWSQVVQHIFKLHVFHLYWVSCSKTKQNRWIHCNFLIFGCFKKN